MTPSDQIRNYEDLQKQVHDALRAQHPEWIQSDGASPICDDYEARFAELLNLFSETTAHRNASRHHGHGKGHDIIVKSNAPRVYPVRYTSERNRA